MSFYDREREYKGPPIRHFDHHGGGIAYIKKFNKRYDDYIEPNKMRIGIITILLVIASVVIVIIKLLKSHRNRIKDLKSVEKFNSHRWKMLNTYS